MKQYAICRVRNFDGVDSQGHTVGDRVVVTYSYNPLTETSPVSIKVCGLSKQVEYSLQSRGYRKVTEDWILSEVSDEFIQTNGLAILNPTRDNQLKRSW